MLFQCFQKIHLFCHIYNTVCVCVFVCVSGLSRGQLSQILHKSVLKLLTQAALSLLRAAGRQALLGKGTRGKEDQPDKWSGGETPSGRVIKLRQALLQSPSRGNQTQTPTPAPTHTQ